VATRPSEPLLAFLRDAVRKKGLNTAQLATRTGIDRTRLKHRLAGDEDLTVDDLIALSKALEITPAELGLAGGEDMSVDADESPGLAAAPEEPRLVAGAPAEPDPFGNLPRQVVQLGFALGVDLFLTLDSTQLAGSGVPRLVLETHRETLRLRMEARYFPQNKARFLDDAMVCVLSFDALYECTLPWSAFRDVTFLLPAEAAPAPRPQPPTTPRPAGPPHLRIVK
jgi:transcriptional regulator with XRE-family HTH domain